MSKHLTRKSDSQANAEALARRSSTYADEHAASWEVRFGRPAHEMSTKELVAKIMEQLAEEVPTKLHEGPDHIDGGGTPAMTAAFMGYIDGGAIVNRSPRADSHGREFDPIIVGELRKPVQDALATMKRAKGKQAWWGIIAERVILYSEPPVVAAMAEGSHNYEAVRTANEALAELYRRITPDKMHLPRRDAAA